MTFTPKQYGNVKNYFESGRYTIGKNSFGWCAWVDFGTAAQKLLSTATSPNTKAGAMADCASHAGSI